MCSWSLFSYQRRGWSEFQTRTTPWTFLFLNLPPPDQYEFEFLLARLGVPDAPNFCKTIRGFVKEEGVRVWTLKCPADAWIWYCWGEECTKEKSNACFSSCVSVFMATAISDASGNWWRFYEPTCLDDFLRLLRSVMYESSYVHAFPSGCHCGWRDLCLIQMGHSVEAAFIVYYMTTSYFIWS